jgi:hypothetical protein
MPLNTDNLKQHKFAKIDYIDFRINQLDWAFHCAEQFILNHTQNNILKGDKRACEEVIINQLLINVPFFFKTNEQMVWLWRG